MNLSAPVALDTAAILRRPQAHESSARTYARSFLIVPVRARGMAVHGAHSCQYLRSRRHARRLDASNAADHRRTRHSAVDEVQTGVGRTGAMWAIEYSGIGPDTMVLSQAIGGSLPLTVIVCHKDDDGWLPGAHTGTSRGNTLAMAAGAATLRFAAAEHLPARATQVGGSMRDCLDILRRTLPTCGDVRGRSLMPGVELVDPTGERDIRGALPVAPELATRVRAAWLKRGLIGELGGRHDSVVRLLPPLTITDEQVEAVLDRLADAISTEGR